jgi:hypothetical protein
MPNLFFLYYHLTWKLKVEMIGPLKDHYLEYYHHVTTFSEPNIIYKREYNFKPNHFANMQNAKWRMNG